MEKASHKREVGTTKERDAGNGTFVEQLMEYSCSGLQQLLDILPAVEQAYNHRPWEDQKIENAINRFWSTTRSFMKTLGESKEPLEKPERERLWNVYGWWAKRRGLQSEFSSLLQGQCMNIVVRSSLAVRDHDMAVRVLAENKFTAWSQHTPIVRALLRDGQGWKLQWSQNSMHSQVASDLLTQLHKHNWPLNPPVVSIHFGVGNVDIPTKTVQYDIRKVELDETESGKGGTTLEWSIGFKFESRALGKKWSAYKDGSGSAEVFDSETKSWTHINRPMRGMISVEQIFDSPATIARDNARCTRTYNDVCDECEAHLRTVFANVKCT
jgi:hypothetical protein